MQPALSCLVKRMSWLPGIPGSQQNLSGEGGYLNRREEGVGTGGRGKLEVGREVKRKGILTFRSSLKASAVAVKCGMTFLQCGHPE